MTKKELENCSIRYYPSRIKNTKFERLKSEKLMIITNNSGNYWKSFSHPVLYFITNRNQRDGEILLYDCTYNVKNDKIYYKLLSYTYRYQTNEWFRNGKKLEKVEPY